MFKKTCKSSQVFGGETHGHGIATFTKDETNPLLQQNYHQTTMHDKLHGLSYMEISNLQYIQGLHLQITLLLHLSKIVESVTTEGSKV
jgi:hypothetical protein